MSDNGNRTFVIGVGMTKFEGAKVALQHNIGLGGACVVTVYRPAG